MIFLGPALRGPRFFYAPISGGKRGDRKIAAGAEVSLMLDDFRDTVEPDPAWLPGTKQLEIVDNEGHLAMVCQNDFRVVKGLYYVPAILNK
jgi:hypothetical protein